MSDPRLTTIRNQILDRIEEVTVTPKVTYLIDGQRVDWQSYLEGLFKSLEAVDAKLQQGDVREVITRGMT